MRWRNEPDRYGLAAVILHWLTATIVLLLFALGVWMTGLDYYDPWYRQAPSIHKSIGVVLFFLLSFRLLWRLFGTTPAPLPEHAAWERVAAKATHFLLYLLVFTVMISGYFISTADGRAIELFAWLELPALISGIEGQEEIAGKIHWAMALSLLSLVGLHFLAALKHHWVDRDRTLLRMLGR